MTHFTFYFPSKVGAQKQKCKIKKKFCFTGKFHIDLQKLVDGKGSKSIVIESTKEETPFNTLRTMFNDAGNNSIAYYYSHQLSSGVLADILPENIQMTICQSHNQLPNH